MIVDIEPLKAQLKRQEAVMKFPYKDSRGIWTIGVGHNMTTSVMMSYLDDLKLRGISDEEIDVLLDADIGKARASVDRYIKYPAGITSARYLALINLCFNMGIGILLTFRKFITAIQDQNWTEAANQLLYNAQGGPSKYYLQVHGRATELAKQIETGEIV